MEIGNDVCPTPDDSAGWYGGSKRVFVDLDGTLADYSKGFQGFEIIGPPLPETRPFLKRLTQMGYQVWIWTVRVDPGPRTTEELQKHKAVVRAWLQEHDLVQFITGIIGKPYANFYVDDRAITFAGSVENVLRHMKMFGRWWEKAVLDDSTPDPLVMPPEFEVFTEKPK